MRRSASRRSRTLLLKARPPAMRSPPEPDCPPGCPSHRAVEPSVRFPCRQGTRDNRRVFLGVFVRGNELEMTRESVHDEVVTRAVYPAARERGEGDEEAENKGSSGSHRRGSFLAVTRRARRCCPPSAGPRPALSARRAS